MPHQPRSTAVPDQRVPDFGGMNLQRDRLAIFAYSLDSTPGRMHDHAVKSSVAHENVTAPTQDEEWQLLLCRELHSLTEILHGNGQSEIARRPTNLERGVGLQRLFFLDYQAGWFHL